MQPSLQSIGSVKMLVDDAYHQAGDSAPAHLKRQFSEIECMDANLTGSGLHASV